MTETITTTVLTPAADSAPARPRPQSVSRDATDRWALILVGADGAEPVTVAARHRAPAHDGVAATQVTRHRRACPTSPQTRQEADVLISCGACTGDGARGQLEQHPGAAVYAQATGRFTVLLQARHRAGLAQLTATSSRRTDCTLLAALGSALHAWCTAGRDPADLRTLIVLQPGRTTEPPGNPHPE